MSAVKSVVFRHILRSNLERKRALVFQRSGCEALSDGSVDDFLEKPNINLTVLRGLEVGP